MNPISKVGDYESLLKPKFKNKYGKVVITRDILSDPAYLHLDGHMYAYSDLLTRMVAFLKKSGDWIDERTLIEKARVKRYPEEIIISTVARLKELENIGYSKWKFMYYPESKNAEFNQHAIDTF